MTKKIIFLFLLILVAKSNYAQINVIQDESISLLMLKQKKDFSGYRIQVFSGRANERSKAESIKRDIEQNYQTKAYINYTSNNFRVQIGDFISKIDAVPIKYKLRRKYRNCYIVKVKEINLIDKDNKIENPTDSTNNDEEVNNYNSEDFSLEF